VQSRAGHQTSLGSRCDWSLTAATSLKVGDPQTRRCFNLRVELHGSNHSGNGITSGVDTYKTYQAPEAPHLTASCSDGTYP